ncbi:hypothetical protein ACJRO7_001867 [Eucalyptus globulus]|uniref:Uncharacterized protein n=1 Tax=Eucalyptus globulus TaxID=34317 RepID=A0ABD3LT93_EUCGL
MDLANGQVGSEQLQAQAHIWNHIFNSINSMCLKCAIQLGIPDTIHRHGQPMALDTLVSTLQIHPSRTHSVHGLMRILLPPDGRNAYVLNHLLELLVKDNPSNVARFALATLDPIFVKLWHCVSTWFHNSVDGTPFEMVQGMSFWRYVGQEPRLNRLFNDGMASDARLVASMVVNEHKGVLEGITSLVDVGGGTGTMAKAIARAFPHMECTIYDLPHVVANLEVSENMRCVMGTSLKPYHLQWILHDWSDEERVKTLKRCKETISKGKGKSKNMIKTPLFFDVLMMTLASGRERNETEWAKLFVTAGFGDYQDHPCTWLAIYC